MTKEISASMPVEIGLTAAIVALFGSLAGPVEPMILVAWPRADETEAALPSGHFDPLAHRTFDIGLRATVAEQTGVPLGYVEQLYTFGDRGRHARLGDSGPHVVSVGYLALTRIRAAADQADFASAAGFRPWYGFFPWEDWREGRPPLLDDIIRPALEDWAKREARGTEPRGPARSERVRLLFGAPESRFDDENVLERYELLYEAGLVAEARRDGRDAALARKNTPPLGQSMPFDHRRILATAMGRLRAKMKYRPVIFELMPQTFTLTELQHAAEAISGRELHKQNFRRLFESAAVVEPTGQMSHATGGRPAALFRFRREILQERPAPGLRFGARG